jgi:hypothetical protein
LSSENWESFRDWEADTRRDEICLARSIQMLTLGYYVVAVYRINQSVETEHFDLFFFPLNSIDFSPFFSSSSSVHTGAHFNIAPHP